MDALSRYLNPPLRHGRLLWALSIVLLSIACWFAVEAHRQHQRAERAMARNATLLSAQAQTSAPTLSRPEREDQKRWAALRDERNFAWEPLFRAVERAANPDIELLEFRPDKNSRRVEMRGRARDRQALIAFLGTLAAQGSFRNVHLAHQQATARGGLETVAFTIKATLVEY